MSGKLNRECVNCGEDNWWSIDNKTEVVEVCSKCLKTVDYKKSEFLDEFVCDKCSSNDGTLCDNDTNITIVCKKCGTPKIVFEKHYVQVDNRNKIGIIVNKQPEIQSGIVKCPICRSVQISTSKRGFSLLTGFIGANKTVNRCARCGHTWQPR